jgi:hypothetical protein
VTAVASAALARAARVTRHVRYLWSLSRATGSVSWPGHYSCRATPVCNVRGAQSVANVFRAKARATRRMSPCAAVAGVPTDPVAMTLLVRSSRLVHSAGALNVAADSCRLPKAWIEGGVRPSDVSSAGRVPSRADQTDTRIYEPRGAEAPGQRTARGRLLRRVGPPVQLPLRCKTARYRQSAMYAAFGRRKLASDAECRLATRPE